MGCPVYWLHVAVPIDPDLSCSSVCTGAGEALQQPSTPAIHVTGKNTLLSVYELRLAADRDAALAVFRTLELCLPANTAGSFRGGPPLAGHGAWRPAMDTTEGDAAVQPVLDELRVLMANGTAGVV